MHPARKPKLRRPARRAGANTPKRRRKANKAGRSFASRRTKPPEYAGVISPKGETPVRIWRGLEIRTPFFAAIDFELAPGEKRPLWAPNVEFDKRPGARELLDALSYYVRR